MDYTAIIQDDQFQRLAALLRVATRPAWQSEHPDSKFGFHYNNFVVRVKAYTHDMDRDLVIAYTGMTTSVAEADPVLATYVNAETLEWFIGVLAGDHASTTLWLLLSVAACEAEMLTPVEAAEASGMSESHWRNQCASGSIPGAQKKGKQWLIPRSWIRYSQFAE